MAKRSIRKRVLSLLTALTLTFSLLPTAASAEGTGSGTIEIGSAEELIALFEMDFSTISEADIVLTDDIDMADTYTFEPLGGADDPANAVAFNGTLDGNGYTISNLEISAKAHSAGLFSYVGTEGTIKNLTLEDISVSAKGCSAVGAVAGCLTGSVSRCTVTGTVSGKSNVGGMAGILHAGTIENCVTDIDVTASSAYAGGLFGNANYDGRSDNVSPLTECLSSDTMDVTNNLIMGSVTASNRAGGMLGDFGNSLTSALGDFSGNVVWVDSITSDNTYGYAYAWWTDSTSRAVTTENVYCDAITLSVPEDSTPVSQPHVNFTTRTDAQLRTQRTYEKLGWDFDRVWSWDGDAEQPVLRDVKDPLPEELDPLYIDTAEELQAFFEADFERNQKREVYLTADIDMSGCEALAPLGIDADGTVFAYNGSFDGQGHVIRNLTIEGVTDKNDGVGCTGFFAYVGEKGKIKNLGLENISVTGKRNVGGLAGCLTGSVSECYITGTVSGTQKVGGMAGILHGASVNNCWLDMDVQATGSVVGGLFGDANYISRQGKVEGSPLTACSTVTMNVNNVLVLGTVSGKNKVGGMVGDVGNSLTSPVGSFDGNVIWIEAYNYTGDSSIGPVSGWWSNATYPDAEDSYSLYVNKMKVNGTEQTFTDVVVDVFNPIAASSLGAQATYENATTGLGWDFSKVWVWSNKLGHPVLRGVTAPAAGDPLDQKTPASLVTTFVDSPKTSRAFTWYTDSSVEETVVQFVSAADYVEDDDTVFSEVEGTCSELQVDIHGEMRNIHKANLTGLEPGTTYYYRAGGDGHWSGVYAFTTEAEDADSFTFFSMTDTQASGFKKYGNYQNYVKVLEDATTRYPDGAFVLQGGDVIQNNYLEHYDKVYELTREYAATLPVMLTPGNHELGKNNLGYLNGLANVNSHYQFPDNGPDGSSETVYSFDYGDAHIAVLDSNKTVGYSAQIEWLKEDMANTDKAWKMVSIHVGPYNNYGKGTQSLIDAMDELGIDLVFFGHNHTFLRSNPIKNGVTDATTAGYEFLDGEGTVYYSSGCAGGTAGKGGTKDDQVTNPEKMAKTYFSVLEYDAAKGQLYGAITVTEDTLTVRTYALSEKKLVDEFVITKPEVTAPAAREDLVYSGEEQELILAGSATGGTMLYSLDGETYSETIPAATDAGTYTVWYRVDGINDADDTQSLEVTIAPLDITGAEITLGTALTYTGAEQTQTVESVVINGLPVTYTVSGNTAVEAGDYTLTVTASGNFCGTATKAWSMAGQTVTPPQDGGSGEDGTGGGSNDGGTGESTTAGGIVGGNPGYRPVIDKTDGGDVSVDSKRPRPGDQVTVTPEADEGFTANSIVIRDQNGNKLEVTDNGDGTYSYVQPVGQVTIEVIFEEMVPLSGCPRNELCVISDFTDADPTAWYHDGLHYCLEHGLMNGKTETAFVPDGNVTRQQVWMILARMSGAAPANMAEARAWAMDNGISDGTAPGGAITRQQLATMLYRYAQQRSYDVSVGEDTNILSYEDVFQVSEYAIPALQWSCGSGVMGGYSDGTLRPMNHATRAHAAVMFQRFCEYVLK